MATRREKTHPDTDALLQHLRALKLPFMLEQHQALAQTAADKPWSHLEYLGELLAGEAAARDDRRPQDARSVRLELAHQDQPVAHPKPVSPGLCQAARQRRVHLGNRSGQEPSDDGAGPRCLHARPLGAIHRRHRHHQHPCRRAGLRQHQACAAPLHQTRSTVHRLMWSAQLCGVPRQWSRHGRHVRRLLAQYST